VLRRLRFRHRIGLLVLLAAAALITTAAVTLVLGQRSQRELVGIETRYVPLVELDRDLKTAFLELTRALEDAASAADEGRLADADRLDGELLARLASSRHTLIGNGAVPLLIERDYRTYFASARRVSAAIVAGTPIEQLTAEIETMHASRQTFTAHLESATTPDRRRLAAAFETARASQESALRIEITVALAAIAAMVLMSWWITRRTVRSLHEVGAGVERLARGEFGHEIEVDSGDEIGDLAREANRTALQLREYRDRSEQLLAETQRQAQELARARQAQQERAEVAENATRELEAFSYSVAHDLRAPLRGINGFASALVEDFGDKVGPEAKDYLARISAGAVRMGELIDALLGLSRVSRAGLTRQSVNLTKLATDVLAQLRAAEPSRAVRCIVQDALTVDGDPQLLRALLENLLGNAWKFVGKRDDAQIELGRDGDTLFVRDNGAGFDMAYADKLFTPFQRLHSATEYAGTGIGLATVQRIVHRHGGKIWAESAVNQGATFYFTLPAPSDREGAPHG
jgi:signal transduction histidine kinase